MRALGGSRKNPGSLIPLDHRLRAYSRLSGNGLEIGAFNEPALVPAASSVKYFDFMDEKTAMGLFPEVDSSRLVHVDYIGDLDAGGLGQFGESSFDFVIINHVLEHVANPIGAIEGILRVIRAGGALALSIPDKRYTFDRGRAETPFDHLWLDYANGVKESSDEHYLDFFRSAAPHVFSEPAVNLPHHVARSRARRDHAHVWTSEGFRAFLDTVFDRLGVKSRCLAESMAAENQIEYFGLWEISSKPPPA